MTENEWESYIPVNHLHDDGTTLRVESVGSALRWELTGDDRQKVLTEIGKLIGRMWREYGGITP